MVLREPNSSGRDTSARRVRIAEGTNPNANGNHQYDRSGGANGGRRDRGTSSAGGSRDSRDTQDSSH
jgi:hypothetical protein